MVSKAPQSSVMYADHTGRPAGPSDRVPVAGNSISAEERFTLVCASLARVPSRVASSTSTLVVTLVLDVSNADDGVVGLLAIAHSKALGREGAPSRVTPRATRTFIMTYAMAEKTTLQSVKRK